MEEKIIQLIKENKEFPLIEECNDKKSIRITFVYIGDEAIKNVVVINPIGKLEIKENIMIKIKNKNIWYKTYICVKDLRFRYYFSINDSLKERDMERLKNGKYDRLNSKKIKFSDGYIMSYVELGREKIKERNIELEGKLETYKIYSKYLYEKRKITVYIPKNYVEEKFDGGFIIAMDREEAINILNLEYRLEKLINNKKIESTIGVFIETSKNRNIEMRNNILFEKFLTKEVIPFIQKKYKILMNPKKNIISGFSLGGLCATCIGFKNEDIFRNILVQSSSYFLEEKEVIKLIKNSNKSIKVYMSTGILESKKFIEIPNKKIYSRLINRKLRAKYEMFKGGHDYLSWGEFFERGLIYLLEKRNGEN